MSADDALRGGADPVVPDTAATPDLDAVSDAVESPAPPPGPRTEAPSPDVAIVPAASRLPGAARDGYHSLPTAPVVTATSGPVDGESVPWEQSGAAPEPRASIGPWALGLAILALITSFFVGWMLPLGAVAIVGAIMALRRYESRPVAVWALVLGAVAVVYSAGWLIWAFAQSSA